MAVSFLQFCWLLTHIHAAVDSLNLGISFSSGLLGAIAKEKWSWEFCTAAVELCCTQCTGSCISCVAERQIIMSSTKCLVTANICWDCEISHQYCPLTFHFRLCTEIPILIPQPTSRWTLEIAPVLLLVLDLAGPELDRINAGPIFGPAPVRYLHFCVAHVLKPTMLKWLSHKALNLQQLHDTWLSESGLCTFRRAKLLTHTSAHMSRALFWCLWNLLASSTAACVNATMVSLVSSKLLKLNPVYRTPVSTSKYGPWIWWCAQLRYGRSAVKSDRQTVGNASMYRDHPCRWLTCRVPRQLAHDFDVPRRRVFSVWRRRCPLDSWHVACCLRDWT